MFTRRIFQLTAILAVYTLLFIPSNNLFGGESCNKPSDLHSGSGKNSDAYGHAEVIILGWWGHSANVTSWGYVNNCSDKEITCSLRFEFWVVRLNNNFEFLDAQHPPFPPQFDQRQLDPGEIATSSYTYGYTITDEKWAAGKTFRAETITSVSARTVGRGNDQDQWEATGCVDVTFGRHAD